jgi:hypothetical protein
MPSKISICILIGELPFDGSLLDVSRLLLGVYLGLQEFSARDPPIQALPAEDADFDLRHVQPVACSSAPKAITGASRR